jgi:GNAT superfamily N-acetyltransferase
MTNELRWSTLDVHGRSVLRYVAGMRDGRPLADLAEPLTSDAAGLVIEALPGWVIASSDRAFVTDLTAHGARLTRHRYVMSAPTAPHADAPLDPPSGIHLVPLREVSVDQLLPSWLAAYPDGHVDHESGSTQDIIDTCWDHLADPQWWTTMHRSTAIAYSADTIVGGIIVDVRPQPVPFGGPWLSDIWRRPGHGNRGLGTWLIARAMRLLYDDGWQTLGLSVTHGNPARRIYDRVGFVEKLESWTLRVPE